MHEVTPELLQWIVAQAEAGHPTNAVMQALRSGGWDEEAARWAIELSRRSSLVEPPAPMIVPQPNVADSPGVVRTSDREVQVLAVMKSPRVIVFGGLLANDECDALIELARGRMKRSVTVDGLDGGDTISEQRTSEGTHINRSENDVVQRVEARIAELLNWPIERGESLQILRYGVGDQYHPHYDYFDPTVPGAGRLLSRGGHRVATLVMYLRAPDKGGATIFPDAGLEVTALKGNAVFFSYDRPHPISRTLHGGAPVIAGEKWVATKWLRAEVFA